MKMNLYLDITDMPDDKKLQLNADKDLIMTPDGKCFFTMMAEVIPASLKIKFLDPIMFEPIKS